MQIHRKSVMAVHMAADAVAVVCTFFVFLFSLRSPAADALSFKEVLILAILLAVWFWSARFSGLYDEFRSRNFSFELITLAKVAAAQLIVGITLLYLSRETDLPRSFIFMYASSLFIAVGGSKYAFRKVLERLRLKGRNLRSILIVGAGEMGLKFSESIAKNRHFGYKLIGFIDNEKSPSLNGSYLGPIGLLDSVLFKNRVDVVIVALPNEEMDQIASVVDICEQHTTRVKIIPNYLRFVSSKYSMTMFDEFPMLSLREERINEINWRLLKRGFDITVSVLAFIFLFSWMWPIIAIAIKLSSKGHVFFKQERWGRNNRPFYVYKFRSMKPHSEWVQPDGHFVQTEKNDVRVTRVGKFLRRTNLDELPQFINVFKGQMSIVGPRPHASAHNAESRLHVRRYMLRHLVKPGITGWAQVNGYRGEITDISLMQKRVEYDLWYIENWSLWLDLQIIFLTLWRMVKGDPKAY